MIAAIQPITAPPVYLPAIMPILILGIAGFGIVLGRALARQRPGVLFLSAVAALVALGTSGTLLGIEWHFVGVNGPYVALSQMIAIDKLGIFLSIVVIIAAVAGLLIAMPYLMRENVAGPEYIALVLFSVAGMMAMITANDLITMFVALELLSLPLYILTGFNRRRFASQEGALKYFVLGAFSSAIFLYGVALVYGATGNTSLTAIAQYLSTNLVINPGVLVLGILLLVVGLGFKIALVPFHMWAPDAYEGAPTPVTAFMAAATKTAAFGALIRILFVGMSSFSIDWKPVLWVLAALSMVAGSTIALVQTDVKRMLAYSSISHAGYILIGIQINTSRGLAASVQYLAIYGAMVLGAFTVVALISGRNDDHTSLTDLKGLSKRQPWLAIALSFFVLAQAGVPFTGGFVAKLSVFAAGIAAKQYALVIIGVLAAVVGAAFYLRIVLTMYSTSEGEAHEPISIDPATVVVLMSAAAFVLVLGFLPQSFADIARHATLIF